MKRRLILKETIEIPYVQEGLVLYLDGRDNLKGGTWNDRVNSLPVTLYGIVSHSAKGYVFNGGYGILDNRIASLISNYSTLEVLVTRTSQTYYSDPIVADGLTSLRMGIGPHYGDGTINTTCIQQYMTQYRGTIPTNSLTNISVQYPERKLYVNNVLHNTEGADNYLTLSDNKFYLAGRNLSGTTEGYFIGTIHSIRLYNRKLSVSEIQQNYNVDKQLFS